MSAAIIITAVLLVGLPVGAGMFAAFAWLGARYDAQDDVPVPSSALDTEPWPGPR